MSATATMSTVQCCNVTNAPLEGSYFWSCPVCKTKWDIAGFETLRFNEEIELKKCCD